MASRKFPKESSASTRTVRTTIARWVCTISGGGDAAGVRRLLELGLRAVGGSVVVGGETVVVVENVVDFLLRARRVALMGRMFVVWRLGNSASSVGLSRFISDDVS